MDSKFLSLQRRIFAFLFIGYANYAYNRKSVSLAMPSLLDQGLSKNDAGLIASSQNLAFAFSKFVGGILSDRVSARILFSGGLLLGGIVTVAVTLNNSLWFFVVLWFINGLSQGSSWPACAKIIRHWSPPAQFGTWWSVLSASTNVSGAVTPFFATFIILNYGWRSSIVISGIFSIVVAILCQVYVLNSPEDMGWKSFSADVKSKGKRKSKKSEDSNSTWRDLIVSPFLWLLSICYMVAFCAKTSAVDWGQIYLIEDLGFSQYVGSAFTSSLESGGFVGGVASGYITDWLLSRKDKKTLTSPRMPVAFLFTFGIALGLHGFSFLISKESSQFFISSLGFFMGMCLYGSISIFGVVAAENAPAHLSGTAYAIVALAANIGAVISGLPFSYIAKLYDWCAVFIFLEFITVATIVLMIACWNMKAQIVKSKLS